MKKKKVFIIVLSSIVIALIFPLLNTIEWLRYSIQLTNSLGISGLNMIAKDTTCLILISAIIVTCVVLIILIFKKDLSALFHSTLGEKLSKSKEARKAKKLEKAKKKVEELEKKDS